MNRNEKVNFKTVNCIRHILRLQSVCCCHYSGQFLGFILLTPPPTLSEPILKGVVCVWEVLSFVLDHFSNLP
jgi:hypothetical protein